MRTIGIILALVLVTNGAVAQTTYKSWNNPDAVASPTASDKKFQEFVAKLNALVDKAEKAKAADPTFLRDLRDLANGFKRQANTVVLSDEFLDGNFEANPKWNVLSGEYWVEKGWGLRSAIKLQGQTAAAQPSERKNKDAAAALFGQLLSKALGAKQQTTTPQPAAPNHAAIHSNATIPNAFALEAQFSSWTDEGRLEMVMYQGNMTSASNTAGYRLAYIPGGGVELIRVSSRGTTLLDASKLAIPLEDKKFHSVEWLRHRDGQMTVKIDGKQVLSVADKGFRDPFNGIALINHGGDYILKKLTISGAG